MQTPPDNTCMLLCICETEQKRSSATVGHKSVDGMSLHVVAWPVGNCQKVKIVKKSNVIIFIPYPAKDIEYYPH